MAQREKGGRVVFIGNIPYGVSEEQICDIFGRVGQVINFRLVYDKETGRPKGFGFLEYTDTDAAASAVRNLNEHEIMGRTLRVDYSNDNGGGKSGGQQQQPSQGGAGGGTAAMPPMGASAGMGMSMGMEPSMGGGQDAGAVPSLPPGVDLPAGVSAPDAISQTLSALPPPQLLDILSQMKNLAAQNPQQASLLLSQAPQLGYAIFQALLLLGLVDTNILGSLIQQTGSAPTPQQPPQQMQPSGPPPGMPPMPMGMPPGYPPQPAQFGAGGGPPGFPPPQPSHSAMPPQQPPHFQPPPPQQSYTPVQQNPYQAPPPQPTPQQQQPVQAPLPADPAQAALIQQVLGMTREQVMGLDVGPREQINALRRQFGAPVF
ncbi:hypothetical protein KC351_g9391 [Hortaea werneckii]|nr:hypothetical protein KC351_g9391 [Hortaea werneckii]